MQERPDKLVLLAAISRFLVEEVRPALSDPRLNFRALIAAHLAHVVATEIGSDEAAVTRELGRLLPLFPDVAPPGEAFPARRALLADLSARLAARLRDGAFSAGETKAIAAMLRESLGEKLEIENPRFDLAMEIE
jgi:hypothetical protein